jgi:hypothetical protein
MHVRKIIQAHMRRHLRGVDVATDVNAAIDANVLGRRLPADDARSTAGLDAGIRPTEADQAPERHEGGEND